MTSLCYIGTSLLQSCTSWFFHVTVIALKKETVWSQTNTKISFAGNNVMIDDQTYQSLMTLCCSIGTSLLQSCTSWFFHVTVIALKKETVWSQTNTKISFAGNNVMIDQSLMPLCSFIGTSSLQSCTSGLFHVKVIALKKEIVWSQTNTKIGLDWFSPLYWLL